MDLYLQFGWGMMEHCRALISEWNGGTVVLSPRDLEPEQLVRFSEDIRELPGGQILFDPQFFLPRCDHSRLTRHAFWPDNYDSGTYLHGEGQARLLNDLINLNAELGCEKFILPGLLGSRVNDLWLEFHSSCINTVKTLGSDIPLLVTLALESSAVSDPDQIHDLLTVAEDWDVDGYYIVCEHPNGSYLVDEPLWLANILDLTAGLRIMGKKVILGYCNHQMLIAANSLTNAICSGTWMNVRSFPPAKFFSEYQEEIRKRSIWIYSPDTLTEYKIPFLDIAWRQRILHLINPNPEYESEYVESIFSEVQPTTVGLSERDAFRHYLHCLRKQVLEATHKTFMETVEFHESILKKAEALLIDLKKKGVTGQNRDFSDIIDVNRSALAVLESNRGAMLRRKWTNLWDEK